MKQKRASETEGIKEMVAEVELIDFTPEELLATAGRVCYQSFKKQNPDSDKRLIKHFCSLGHLSVLEHGKASFLVIGASRSFTHQMVRHRHTAISQESQRYCDEGNFGYVIPPNIKACGKEVLDWYKRKMEGYRSDYLELQQLLRNNGFKKANEDARFVLPNAVCSEIYLSANYAQWRHCFDKRCTVHAQWEIRGVTMQMLKLLKEKCPTVFEDFIVDEKKGIATR